MFLTGLAVALAGGAVLAPSAPAAADAPVHILVLKEQGVGSAATGQGYIDGLMGRVAGVNGWSSAVGKYATTRAAAKSWAKSHDPHFGILSLGAFLEMRTAASLEIVGKANVAGAGGREYHVVSKDQTTLAGCKGKTLATNHAGDGKFVDKVVSGADFDLSEFTVVEQARPMQPINAVARGEAACALIDDAQLESLAKGEHKATVKSVWASKKLPPMVIVAFPSAPAGEKSTFKAKLGDVCKDDGKQVCKQAGIAALESGSSKDYEAVIAAYGG
jgi:hypothetical protein